nr:uncharacterized protein LOC129387990 [Dermacentor andersoni]
MARYRCALIWLGLTVGEVWSNASTLTDGVSGSSALSAGGNGTRPELGVQTTRGSRSGLLVLRRLFQDNMAAYKRRFSTPSTSGEAPSASAPTSPPRVQRQRADLATARAAWIHARDTIDPAWARLMRDIVCAREVEPTATASQLNFRPCR